ncbi:MAG: hypothetical protein IIZ93_14715 [Acidaminococcaceae bacterium]|nr:hypothetical protein [Acidaminococcaceae bacterium]
MTGTQMTIFDLLYPDKINPIREVAKMESPYWTTSRSKLIDICNQDPDIKEFAKAVKQEYCPYGLSGHYSRNNRANSIQAYDLKTNLIEAQWNDETCALKMGCFSWEDFAREIADLIFSGEYTDRGTK